MPRRGMQRKSGPRAKGLKQNSLGKNGGLSRNRRIALLVSAALLVVASGAAVWVLTSDWRAGLASVVLTASILRLYSLIRSVVWLWARGEVYREHMNSQPEGWDPTDLQLLKIYRREGVGGDFFPFGVRAIVLQVLYESAASTLVSWAARAVYKVWKYYWFVPLVAATGYLLVFSRAPLPELSISLLFASFVVLCLGALVIAGEAALSYFTFGSWSLAYHRFDVAEQRGAAELSALAGGLITALVANASAIFFASLGFGAFSALQGSTTVRALGLAYYYTLTGFTGNGDAGPTAWQGFLVMAVLYIEAGAYLLVVISLLLDSLGSEPGIKMPWVRRGDRRRKQREKRTRGRTAGR